MEKICILIIIVIFIFNLTLVNGKESENHRHRHKHHKRSHTIHHPRHITTINSSENVPKKHTTPNVWAILNNESRNKATGPKYTNELVDHVEESVSSEISNFVPHDEDDDSIETSTHKIAANCPNKIVCKQNSVKMSEDELTELRIEFVKNQILQKLRLTERPAKMEMDRLPKPIADGYTIQVAEKTDDSSQRLDDYYGKTTQKIIFLNREYQNCKTHEPREYPSACFSFQIPSDVDVNIVQSAKLWIYKEPDNMDYTMNQTYLISEFGHWGLNKNFTKSKPIAIKETVAEEGWEKIDINWPIKNWVQFHDLSHTIEIACETCSTVVKEMPISLHQDRKPFIVIDTLPQRTISRQSRNVNCAAGSTECCREKLFISFAEIGWDDWIIHPAGYDAYFCRGTCSSAASVSASGSHYNTVLRKVMFQKNNSRTKNLELIPCCTATRFSSLQLFYMDSNNTATQKTLPNMIVESCGCM